MNLQNKIVAQPTVLPVEIASGVEGKSIDVQNSKQIQEKVPSGNTGTFVQSESLQACPNEALSTYLLQIFKVHLF